MNGRSAFSARWQAAGVAALAVLPLLPFVSGAISIDGPVFVAVSRQILESPADPFGFEMVWDPTSPDVAVFNRNPPLLSYYLAPFIALFGESDAVLHGALLPFPLIAALAFLGIARRVCAEGVSPAAWMVTTPAFLVLATTLMLDVPVLSLILLGVYSMLRARETSLQRWEWSAGLAAAAAALMKYIGLCAVPLLAAGVVLLLPRKLGAGLRVVGLPVLVLALWGAYTAQLYGSPHFFASTDVITDLKKFDGDEFWNHTATAFVFYGGALVFPVLLWGATLFRAKPGIELAVLGVLLGTAVVTFVLPNGEPPRRAPLHVDEAVLGALGFAGAFALCVRCLRPRVLLGDPVDRFLALWLGGILVFSLFLNWHVNAADALLAAPPLLLLVFRDTERCPSRPLVVAGVVLTLPLSFLLAWSDVDQATAYRTAAARIAAEIGDQPGARYYVGQWGLQHYLDLEGFQPVVPPMYGRSDLEAGDWVATARNVSQLDVTQNMNEYRLRPVWSWSHRSWLPLRTTNADAGTGFYSHHAGYVPWGFSTEPVETIQLGRVVGRR